MNPSSDRQIPGFVQMEEPSSRVCLLVCDERTLADFRKAQLPTDLLDSSPEMGSPGQAVSVTAGAHTTMTAQPTAAAQSVTTSEPIISVQPSIVTQGLRHHDFVLERNERLEDELWTAMSRERSAPPESGQYASAATPHLRQPGPEGPISLEQPAAGHAQPHPSEAAATFLPPGDGRTPEQRAAAARFAAAVKALAKQREEIHSSHQRQVSSLAESNVNETVDQGRDGKTRILAEEAPHHDADQKRIRSQSSPDHSNVLPAHEPTEPIQVLLLETQDQQHAHQPKTTTSMSSKETNPQKIPNDDSKASEERAKNTVILHDGDSEFNQMMNKLIAGGTIDNIRYHQIRMAGYQGVDFLFQFQFLYYGEWIGPDHELRSKARRPWSVVRAIRSAINGGIVALQDSASPRTWEMRLLPIFKQRWYVLEGHLSDELSSERRGR